MYTSCFFKLLTSFKHTTVNFGDIKCYFDAILTLKDSVVVSASLKVMRTKICLCSFLGTQHPHSDTLHTECSFNSEGFVKSSRWILSPSNLLFVSRSTAALCCPLWWSSWRTLWQCRSRSWPAKGSSSLATLWRRWGRNSEPCSEIRLSALLQIHKQRPSLWTSVEVTSGLCACSKSCTH